MAIAVHIIPSAQIDKTKWDDCINKSPNGLVYATSAFLDTMATHWDALVTDNYDYVMPLPWRRKALLHYVYPPAFIQQLGVFSANEISASHVTSFIKAIPPKYRYCELRFNYANALPEGNITRHKNYLLHLQPGYKVLHNNYSRSAKRNITKAASCGITIKDNVAPAEIIAIHRARFNDAIGASADDYHNFNRLCSLLYKAGMCITAGAFNNQNSLIAGSIYFVYKSRLTFILNGNTCESLTCGATHLLKDYIIQTFAGSDYILDFEGSDFEKFARFYEQFGATAAEYYTTLVINRLPFLIRFLK